MKLMTDEIRSRLPKLYAQEKAYPDPLVHAKFFTPDSNWTWFVTEGEPQGNDFIFFGYVIGFEREWGTFALSELEAAKGPFGQSVERDLYFTPGKFSEIVPKETL